MCDGARRPHFFRNNTLDPPARPNAPCIKGRERPNYARNTREREQTGKQESGAGRLASTLHHARVTN